MKKEAKLANTEAAEKVKAEENAAKDAKKAEEEAETACPGAYSNCKLAYGVSGCGGTVNAITSMADCQAVMATVTNTSEFRDKSFNSDGMPTGCSVRRLSRDTGGLSRGTEEVVWNIKPMGRAHPEHAPICSSTGVPILCDNLVGMD